MQKSDWESKKINKRKKKDFTFQTLHSKCHFIQFFLW